MNLLTISLVVFAVFSTVYGQYNTCPLVNGSRRRCISLYDCPPLYAIATNPRRTQQEINLVQRSACSERGKPPKVCCPEAETTTTTTTTTTSTTTPASTGTIISSSNLQCFTPEGLLGQCVSVYSCPQILSYIIKNELAAGPYISARQCNGTDVSSVCCALSTPSPQVCASQLSAYPPSHLSGCCGIHGNNVNKIFGGSRTGVDQYPWLALIEYSVAGIKMIKTPCGGNLISGKYVLTAAHCVAGLRFKTPVNVRLGEYQTTNEGQDCVKVEGGGDDCTDGAITIPIEKTIPHPRYTVGRTDLGYDIALIRLKEMAPYTYFIRPICLPAQDITLKSGIMDMFVAGWGAVEDKTYSPYKMHVQLPFVNHDECQAAYRFPGRNKTILREHLCAGGEKGKDSCKGDSGGPLMLETPRLNDKFYELVGIVSTGYLYCGTENVPGVYTHVYLYDSWIKSNIMP